MPARFSCLRKNKRLFILEQTVATWSFHLSESLTITPRSLNCDTLSTVRSPIVVCTGGFRDRTVQSAFLVFALHLFSPSFDHYNICSSLKPLIAHHRLHEGNTRLLVKWLDAWTVLRISISYQFLPRDTMHSTACDRAVFVRPCVCHVRILYRNEKTYPQTFHLLVTRF